MARTVLWMHLLACAFARRIWDRFRRAPNLAVFVVAATALIRWGRSLAESAQSFLANAGPEPDRLPVGFASALLTAAAVSVVAGSGRSLRRLLQDPVRDPWLVLGGSFRTLGLSSLAHVVFLELAVFGITALVTWPTAGVLSGETLGFVMLLTGAWLLAVTVTLAAVSGMVSLVTRVGATAAVWLMLIATGTAGVFLGLGDAIELGRKVVSATSRAIASLRPYMGIAFVLVSTLAAAALVPTFLRQHEPARRDRLRCRVSNGLRLRRRILPSVRVNRGNRTLFSIGARLATRTLLGAAIRALAFSLLVGAVSTVYMETEGRPTATLFAASLLMVILIDVARRGRVSVGLQQEFLWLHSREVPLKVWRSLSAGYAASLSVIGLVCYAGVVGFHLEVSNLAELVALGGSVVEVSSWLSAVSHLFMPCVRRDSWARAMVFYMAACFALGFVSLKILLFLAWPAFLLVQSLASAGIAVWVGGRAPWGWSKPLQTAWRRQMDRGGVPDVSLDGSRP